MTRKDYQIIASVFKREMSLTGGDEKTRKYIVSGLARMLATEFERNNQQFNRSRFLEACDIT